LEEEREKKRNSNLRPERKGSVRFHEGEKGREMIIVFSATEKGKKKERNRRLLK